MTSFEFLSRISFFSILSWCFFLVAVSCAIILTNFHSPLVRKYRATLLSVAFSGIVLGAASWSTPFLLRKINPDQSRLTSLDALAMTQWIEPVSNPETNEANLSPEETAWAKPLGYHFKFKMGFLFEFGRFITLHESTLMLLDRIGSLRGFNAYTGLNHWQIDLGITHFIQQVELQKKLFILDHVITTDALRITCLDLQAPSVLWQRTLPNTHDGALELDLENQTLVVSAGTSGIWALKSKTGEILWKRPEIYTKIQATVVGKQILVFEPSVIKKAGSWYFLDALTGTIQTKTPHVYPDLVEAKNVGSLFLAHAANDQLFAFNLPSLNPLWSFNLLEKPAFYEILSSGAFLVFYQSQMMEKRSIDKNAIEWQKKFTDVAPKWIRFSSDRKLFALPTAETQAVSFYSTESGDYIASATASDPILDFTFFGEWMYIFSENRMWGYHL